MHSWSAWSDRALCFVQSAVRRWQLFFSHSFLTSNPPAPWQSYPASTGQSRVPLKATCPDWKAISSNVFSRRSGSRHGRQRFRAQVRDRKINVWWARHDSRDVKFERHGQAFFLFTGRQWRVAIRPGKVAFRTNTMRSIDGLIERALIGWFDPLRNVDCVFRLFLCRSLNYKSHLKKATGVFLVIWMVIGLKLVNELIERYEVRWFGMGSPSTWLCLFVNTAG